ncbi:allergin-1 [Rhinoderma darwinii]|uniref:allergin-1 n=1 Tax=Rhinoderma darwinii TaxID=43563 RepID=UPI003F66B37B
MIRQTETITCISRNASLPVTYILFLNNITVEKRMVSTEREVAFNVTIYNRTSLGPYKCRANNSVTTKYSDAFTYTLKGRLLQIELVPSSPSTKIGCRETITCISRNASLPVTYILFLNNITVEKRMVSTEREVAFNVTIYNRTSLGPYKCRANNSVTTKYSDAFTYTLKEQRNQQDYRAWLIPLLIVIGILVIVLYIIFAKYKKSRVVSQPVQYCEVGPINGRVDGSERGEDEVVEYCTVVTGRGSRGLIETEESVEYMKYAKKAS